MLQHKAHRDSKIMNEVQGLAPYRDGCEISRFIKTLESDLKEIGVPKSKFKKILLRKLSPRPGIWLMMW